MGIVGKIPKLLADVVVVWVVASLLAWFILLAAGATASGAYPALHGVPQPGAPVVHVAGVIVAADQWILHRL